MRGLAILLGLLVLVVIGGFITTQLGDGGLVSVVEQTNNPSASTSQIEGWQAEQFFLLVGFLVVNMVGIGVTIAGVMWWLNRGVKQAEAMEVEAAENDS